MDKKKLAKEMYAHLTGKLMPFWLSLKDDEQGGFYGYVGDNLEIDKQAMKGCILNSRIMWFFSNCYMLLSGDAVTDLGSQADNKEMAADKALMAAKHAYSFMTKYCIDREYGGVLWSVDYDGKICEDIKHTYNQAFGIYALSSYFDATNDFSALKEALGIYDIIESKCVDNIGYLEAFNRDFTPASNEKLSENGVMADKTMNTLLHVLEAYTELLRVIKKAISIGGADKVDYMLKADQIAQSLTFGLDILADRVYNPELERQEVFFDADYNSIIDLHSYGHDIEASWLVDKAIKVLGDANYQKKIGMITKTLAERIYMRAYKKHSLMNECERGVDNTFRIWWVQAETVLGFYNAGEKLEADPAANADNESNLRPNATLFFDAAADVWEYIKTKLVDPREGSEWFYELDDNGEPNRERPIVEQWKCPYHNGRMCLEVISRASRG